MMKRFLAALASLLAAGCMTDPNAVFSAVRVYPMGGDQFMITCVDSIALCASQARKQCPSGYDLRSNTNNPRDYGRTTMVVQCTHAAQVSAPPSGDMVSKARSAPDQGITPKPDSPGWFVTSAAEPWYECAAKEINRRDVFSGTIPASATAIASACRHLYQSKVGGTYDTEIIAEAIERRRAKTLTEGPVVTSRQKSAPAELRF